MQSTWFSLLWKEWREHRWKMAALVAIYLVTPLALNAGEGFYFALSMTFNFVIPVASMFVAMGIAAGEQARGTITYLQALPAAPSRAAAAKLLVAAATLVVPVLIAVGTAWLLSSVNHPAFWPDAIDFDLRLYRTVWGLDSWFAARALAGSLGAVSILLWMAAAGVNSSDEVRAGAVGLLVALVVWSALVYIDLVFRDEQQWLPWMGVLYAAAPGGVATVGAMFDPVETAQFRPYMWAAAGLALAVHVALALWYVIRLGRVAAGSTAPVAIARPGVDKVWLAPPRRGPLAAIAWKQLRESGPLALLGAAMIVAATLLFAVYQQFAYGEGVEDVVLIASVVGWAWMGALVALVAGIGLFMEELQPPLYAFWRSRPMGVNQWFAVKFFTGLVVTLVTIAIPAVVALAGTQLVGLQMDDHERMMLELRQFAPTMFWMQLTLFCLAALGILLMRQAIYAALWAIAAGGVVLLICDVFEVLGDASLLAAFAITAAAATALAWLAARNDWGWKH